MDAITLRMIERIMGVLIGGLSIYLGFYLFKIIPHSKTGEGKFTFPGVSIHLFRTGPGVFFALFGCAIIYWSFSHPISVDGRTSREAVIGVDGRTSREAVIGRERTFYGVSSEDKAKIDIWIQNLNKMENTIKSEKPSITNEEASITTAQVKLFLIQRMLDDPFDPEFEEFSNKIRINSSEHFGDKWQKWADIYNK